MADATAGSERTPLSGSLAFTRKQKLSKAIDFKNVFKNPFVSSDRYFKVLARLNQQQSSRLGMAVSRHVDKSAVGRNRIKRVIRESFRQRFSGNRYFLDIVVLPKRESAATPNERLIHSLKSHWLRLENHFEG